MECILQSCNNEISTDRQKRRYVTCSGDCGRTHSINKMTKRRAGKRPTLNCGNDDCKKIYIDFGKGDKLCSKCRGSKMGRHDLGRKKNYNYDPVGKGVGVRCFVIIAIKYAIKEGRGRYVTIIRLVLIPSRLTSMVLLNIK